MLNGNRPLAYTRIPASSLMYAEERTERGKDCGKLINQFLKRPTIVESKSHLAEPDGKLEIFLWLGNVKFANSCWNSLPPGYVLDDQMASDRIDIFPRFFEYDKSSVSFVIYISF